MRKMRGREQARVADLIAKGDLSVDITPRSERDLLGIALAEMIESNNEMLSDISMASEQLASGEGQISDSSTVLSQGASEQASSIEQLTAAIEEIYVKTMMNVKMPKRQIRLRKTQNLALKKAIHRWVRC